MIVKKGLKLGKRYEISIFEKDVFCIVMSLSVNMQASRSGNLSSWLPKKPTMLKKHANLPIQSTAASKIEIPIDQSNQALNEFVKQENQKQKKQKYKWYNNQKNINAIAAGLGLVDVGLAADTLYLYTEQQKEKKRLEQQKLEQQEKEEKRLEEEQKEKERLELQRKEKERLEQQQKEEKQKKREKYLKNTIDVKDADPELYAVFLKIKKDMKIDEDVALRIRTDDGIRIDSKNINDAQYDPFFHIIYINNDYKTWSKPFLIKALAHELEHHRQYNRYSGSYAFSSLKDRRDSVALGTQSPTGIHLKLEAGAEAAAAEYFDCPECLKELAKHHTVTDYNPDPNLPSGYFRSSCGYYVKEDYEPFIDRALHEGKLCKGHETLSKIPVDDVEKLKEVRQHLPIADFLPDEAK